MRITGLFGGRNVVDRFILDGVRATLAECGDYEDRLFHVEGKPSDAEYIDILAQTDVALIGWGTPRLPLGLLEHRPIRLRYVCNFTGAIRKLVPRQYLEAGIIVTNWGEEMMWYLAEANLMMILALTREITKIRRHMQEGPQWHYDFAAPSPTLRRKTVALVGIGGTGRLLLDLLAPFDCRLMAYDPYVENLPPGVEHCTSLEALFDDADVVTVLCGLSEETEGLIGRELLDRLGPNAIFINTARGKIVRESELVDFLTDRPDVFAGLDVFEQEPLAADSPLPRMDNVLCYPHCVVGGGDDMDCEIARHAADNIRTFCAGGDPAGVITPEIYDHMT